MGAHRRVASLVVHAAVLALLGLVAPELRPRPAERAPTPALEVRLEPLSSALRQAGAPQPRSSAAPVPRVAPAPFPPLLHRPLDAEPGPPPPAPTPPRRKPEPGPAAPSAPGAPAAAQGSDGARAGPAASGQGGALGAGQEGEAAMRAYGRATVGCDAAKLVRLTQAERDRCSQRFGEEGRKGVWTDPIPPAKRAAYDAEAARIRKCHHYDTPVPMGVPRDRNYRIEPTLDARTPESQHKESTAVLPDEGLLDRWACWGR